MAQRRGRPRRSGGGVRFLAAGAEPEEVAEAVEPCDDDGWGGLSRGREGGDRAFRAAGDAAGHFEPCGSVVTAGSGGGPAFEAVRKSGFLAGGFRGEPVDLRLADRGESRGAVAFLVFRASREHAHDGDEVVLGAGDEAADFGMGDVEAGEPEGGVEFVRIADRLHARVVFGDAAAEEEIGFSAVSASGRDGSRHGWRKGEGVQCAGVAGPRETTAGGVRLRDCGAGMAVVTDGG